jgi:hypothetical protein
VPAKPDGLASDSQGNLFVASANLGGTVYRITTDGTASTFATGLNRPLFIAVQSDPAPPILGVPAQTQHGIAQEGLRILVSGGLNLYYAMDDSTDLSSWTPLQSNALAQAQQALKRFPVAQAQGQWDDGGTGFKVSLLQQLAKAQAEHQLTNEACATLREAATLCEKSENQNLRFELARIVPQLAELGDAEDALATLAAQKSRVLLFTDAAAATGEALMRCMGPLDAISIARAQKDEDLELYLLLGVVGAIGGK